MTLQAPSSPLHYPVPAPGHGQAVEIAPGVLWIQIPLPLATGHINTWALRDGAGWAIVDGGIDADTTRRAWREVMAGPLQGRPITRFIATHMHADHIGLAGWITHEAGCELWMTRREYLGCRLRLSDSPEPPESARRFFRGAGWSDGEVLQQHEWYAAVWRKVVDFPGTFRRIEDGDTLRIGDHGWKVIVGRGHSPEHACLHCPELGLLISGDQVLPRISSNVSVHPDQPAADPMRDWLESIDRIRHLVPPTTLVLPAHNEAFVGLHARLDQLAHGQHAAFDRLRERLRRPARVQDTFEVLFKRPITRDRIGLLSLATGEAMACLNHLLHREEIVRTEGPDGLWHFVHR